MYVKLSSQNGRQFNVLRICQLYDNDSPQSFDICSALVNSNFDLGKETKAFQGYFQSFGTCWDGRSSLHTYNNSSKQAMNIHSKAYFGGQNIVTVTAPINFRIFRIDFFVRSKSGSLDFEKLSWIEEDY